MSVFCLQICTNTSTHVYVLTNIIQKKYLSKQAIFKNPEYNKIYPQIFVEILVKIDNLIIYKNKYINYLKSVGQNT